MGAGIFGKNLLFCQGKVSAVLVCILSLKNCLDVYGETIIVNSEYFLLYRLIVLSSKAFEDYHMSQGFIFIVKKIKISKKKFCEIARSQETVVCQLKDKAGLKYLFYFTNSRNDLQCFQNHHLSPEWKQLQQIDELSGIAWKCFLLQKMSHAYHTVI